MADEGSVPEILAGFGFMLAVGGGFRAALAVFALRERLRTGEHDPNQAKRGAWIYSVGAVAGLLMIAASQFV